MKTNHMWIEYIYNFEVISRNIFHMRINFCLFQSVPYYICSRYIYYLWMKRAFTHFMISRNFSEIEPSRKSIEWKEPFFPLSPACCQNNGKCFFKGSLTYHISSWTTSGLGYKNQRRWTGGSWQKILTFPIKNPWRVKRPV